MDWQSYYHQWQFGFWKPAVFAAFGVFFLALLVWSLYWKGRALWYAARAGNRNWFIALLIINTAGIFEILYLYVFSKGGEDKEV